MAFDALAIEHHQTMVQALPQAVVAKADEPAIGRLVRRKMLGQQPPRTAAAQHIENRVQHFAHRPMAMATRLGGRRQKRRKNPPFLVAQIAAITQMVAVMPRPCLRRPHRRLQEEMNFSSNSIDLPKFNSQPCVSRQPLRETGEPGGRTYELDHELEARRYVGIARRSNDFVAHLRRIFEQRGLTQANDPSCFVDHLLFLWLGNDETRQTLQLRVLSNVLTYGGYPDALLEATRVFRENGKLLTPSGSVEVLVIGGGIDGGRVHQLMPRNG